MSQRLTGLRRLVILLVILLALPATACGAPRPGPSLAVGTTADPETTLLANIYAAGLRYYGTAARVETFPDPLAALDAATVSVVPGFTGRLLERFAPGSAARSAEQVYRAMVGALPEGEIKAFIERLGGGGGPDIEAILAEAQALLEAGDVESAEPAFLAILAAGDFAPAAEDKAALAVTEATADSWGSRDLSAVVGRCGAVRVGAVSGVVPPAAVGSCTLPPVHPFGSAAAMFGGLTAGVITAAWTTTADTSVPGAAVVLIDRKPTLLPAQNVVALYRRNEIDVMAQRAINELAGVLDTAALVDMLRRVKAGEDPRGVAEEWLSLNPLGH